MEFPGTISLARRAKLEIQHYQNRHGALGENGPAYVWFIGSCPQSDWGVMIRKERPATHNSGKGWVRISDDDVSTMSSAEFVDRNLGAIDALVNAKG